MMTRTANAESLADRLLDRSLLPGYSAIGYRLRRRTWDADDPAPGSLAGKRALVTGAGAGLGEATALGLARLGARTHLVVRSPDRAAAAVDRITTTLAEEGIAADLVVDACDLSDLADVRRYAQVLTQRAEAIDIVVHNAGVLPAQRTESVDGHELTVATHVLGPILLTELIRPLLGDRGARVIQVSSGGMYSQALPVSDPEFIGGRYQGAPAYARSKRMQVELAPLLQERWTADDIAVHTMHPGWADTPGVASSLPLFRALTRPVLRDAIAGADTIVWLAATSPNPRGGQFWHDRTTRPTHYRDGTRPGPGEVEEFWSWVRDQLGLV